MPRVLKPVNIVPGVEVQVQGQTLTAKGSKGTASFSVHSIVEVEQKEGQLHFLPRDASNQAIALVGTSRALANNLMIGVSKGFERKLELVGVGYRAQVQGKVLNLTLGYSHPIAYAIPEGITIETPSQTEVIIRGTDKQRVGQVAAVIRGYRPPEPYKGKGVKYSDETIIRKEAKKK